MFFVVKLIELMKKKIKKYSTNKKKLARIFVLEKLKHFNEFYKFKINRVFIKNQRTRWGSCSSKGNLNFNYKIIYLKPELANYLLVHELCHLGQLNHSKKFWTLVSQKIPDYAIINKKLKNINIKSI